MEEMPDERMQRVVQYLEGDLDATERAAFEREVEGDHALRSDMDAARKTLFGLHALGEVRLRRTLSNADTELDGGTRTGSTRWWWAAAAVLLIGASAWLMMQRDTPQQLATEFAYTEPGLPVLMGTSPGAMDAIMNAYKQEDFGTARRLLAVAVEQDPQNDTLQYFNGVLDHREDRCDSAERWFSQVPATSVFAAKARYNLALCALKSGDLARARDLLGHTAEQKDAQVSAKARNLLLRLENM